MKKLVLILVVFLGALFPGASGARAADIDALIDAARAAPGEFAADAMIRLAGTDKVDKARKIELLELAFTRAAEAQQALPRHATPLKLDGSSSYWNRLYLQNLDELSLRLRAIEGLLALDRAKAREWFAKIPPLAVPRLTCDDFMVYDVARFYDILGKVALSDEEPHLLLRKYATAVTSPVQLAPMAQQLQAASNVKDAEFLTLVTSFATAMGKASGDDRSFTFSTALGKAVQALVEECKRRRVTPLSLIEGYRLYLVVNFSGVRCADNDRMQVGQQSFGIYTGQAAEQGAADFVSFFNEKVRMPPLAPIQELEVTPARLEGLVATPRYCEAAECKAFVEQFRGLAFGENGTPIRPADRNTPEWQAKLKARLAALTGWKQGEGANPAEYFREKSGAYSELLNLAQNGPGRESVLRAWVEFLQRNPFQRMSRIEWFLPVNSLVGRVGLDPVGLSQFAEELTKVQDPLISLYASLEAVAPRTPDKILPLL